MQCVQGRAGSRRGGGGPQQRRAASWRRHQRGGRHGLSSSFASGRNSGWQRSAISSYSTWQSVMEGAGEGAGGCRDAGGASRQGGQEQGRGGLPIRRCSSRRRVAQAGAGTHPLPAFTLVGLCVLRHRPLCRLGAAEDCRCRAQRGERPARRAADLQEGRGSPCEPPCWGQSHRRLQPKNKIIIIGVPVT